MRYALTVGALFALAIVLAIWDRSPRNVRVWLSNAEMRMSRSWRRSWSR